MSNVRRSLAALVCPRRPHVGAFVLLVQSIIFPLDTPAAETDTPAAEKKAVQVYMEPRGGEGEMDFTASEIKTLLEEAGLEVEVYDWPDDHNIWLRYGVTDMGEIKYRPPVGFQEVNTLAKFGLVVDAVFRPNNVENVKPLYAYSASKWTDEAAGELINMALESGEMPYIAVLAEYVDETDDESKLIGMPIDWNEETVKLIKSGELKEIVPEVLGMAITKMEGEVNWDELAGVAKFELNHEVPVTTNLKAAPGEATYIAVDRRVEALGSPEVEVVTERSAWPSDYSDPSVTTSPK